MQFDMGGSHGENGSPTLFPFKNPRYEPYFFNPFLSNGHNSSFIFIRFIGDSFRIKIILAFVLFGIIIAVVGAVVYVYLED